MVKNIKHFKKQKSLKITKFTRSTYLFSLAILILSSGVLSISSLLNINVRATSTAGDGFARQMSWDHGQTATFSFENDVVSAQIYQMGLNGTTGQLVATIPVNNTAQPSCLTLMVGAVDCGNWFPSAAWTIPSTAPSSLYQAVPIASDGTAGF